MPSFQDECELMNTECRDTFARPGGVDVVFKTSAAVENPLTGTDSGIGYITATIPAVCHDIRPGFDSKTERRTFGFKVSDLVEAGLPAVIPRGTLKIKDPAGIANEWWSADGFDTSGDRTWIDVQTSRPSGPRAPS